MSATSQDHDTEIDHLLILTADEIKYDSLSTLVLSKLALQNADPFIATSALGELTQRNSGAAGSAAEQIVERAVWDSHLTAYALTILYDRDPRNAISKMSDLIQTNDDPVVLSAMIENVLSDVTRFRSGPGEVLANALVHRVAEAASGTFKDEDLRDKFLKLFS